MALLTRVWPLMQKFLFQDATDPTKQAELDLTGIATGTKRSYAVPDKNGTLALLTDVTGRTPQVTSSITAPSAPATGDIWVDMN